jgi:spore germination protein YaaH
MVEMGYISNQMDNQLFDRNFDGYANAIASGIMKSLTEPYPPAVPPPYFNYIVQSGDTLWSIAQRFGTTMEAIMTLNNITSNVMIAGMILKIPGSA